MTEAITVMHLRASNFVGGPEKQILEHFARIDHTIYRPLLGTFVESGAQDPLGDEALRRGFQRVCMPAASPLNPAAVMNVARLLRQENVTLLCTHGYKPNVLGFCAARMCGIPTIAISRGWTWESRKIRLYESVDRWFLRLVDHVVAVSAGQQEKILACGVPHQRVSVIHNAINLADCMAAPIAIKQELRLPEGALLVASAGRLSPEKNYATMIKVAKRVMQKNSAVYFAIFGEGFLREQLEQLIRENGLEGRFFLPGFRADLQALFHDIDIFMLPSLTEGLPNVALEAFAARKPIVATAVGGTPEVVQDGISGYLTTPDNVTFMAERVLQLAGDAALRRDMGLAGYRYVEEHFGFEAQTRKYEELYEAIHIRRPARS